MKKKFKVLLADCDDASIMTLHNVSNYLMVHRLGKNLDVEAKNKQLIIISDDEIKNNDYYVDDTNSIRKCVVNDDNYWRDRLSYKKIISSSNPQLNLPLIPKSFIEYFIEQYNKKNMIKEIEIECSKSFFGYFDEGGEDWRYLIKVNDLEEIQIVIPEEKNHKLVCSQSENCNGCNGVHCKGTFDGSKRLIDIEEKKYSKEEVKQLLGSLGIDLILKDNSNLSIVDMKKLLNSKVEELLK